MDPFGRSFRRLLKDWIYFIMKQMFPSSVGRWRNKNCKFAVEIFQNVK